MAAIHTFQVSYISYSVIVVWQYNKTQLQGPNTTVCGEYCCLFALYKDRAYTPQQFEGLFAAASDADQRIHHLVCSEFGPTLCKQRSGRQ